MKYVYGFTGPAASIKLIVASPQPKDLGVFQKGVPDVVDAHGTCMQDTVRNRRMGHHSGETINLFALAIRKGLTASDLRDLLFAYPTHASDIHTCCEVRA